MKKNLLAIASLAACFAAAPAFAQYKIATGNLKAGSTYATMQQQMNAVCTGHGTTIVESNGTLDNFNMLADNSVNGAWVQADVLFFAKKNDPDRVANLFTIVGLHREALHFVARGQIESGGFGVGKFKIGTSTKEMRDLGDARGMRIGAVGGSFETAKIVNAVGGLKMELVRVTDNNQLLGGLKDGKIDVALFVGGINYGPIQQLSREFRLLTVPEDIIKATSDVYSTMSVSYRNLEQTGVKTLNTQALLVTQNYSSPKMVAAIKKIRQCFNDNAEDIAESTGTNPAWRDVKKGQDGKWPLFKLD